MLVCLFIAARSPLSHLGEFMVADTSFCQVSKDSEPSVVPLLQQICLLIQEHESLLDLFYVDGEGQKPSKFLVFTQLIPHMHSSKEEGKRSRDAMLVCLFIAARSPLSHLGEFMVADTSFCQVLFEVATRHQVQEQDLQGWRHY